MNILKTSYKSLATRTKRLAALAAVAATSLGVVAMSGTASAQQYCAASAQSCLNAWNGGPAVNVESPGAANNNFRLGSNGPYNTLVFNGSSSYSGACVSDYGNSQTNARAGLNACGNGTPWGANFNANVCNGVGGPGYVFQNIHWTNGYLGPSGGVGSAFYLNKPTAWCFTIM